jgi:hypothetical protein
VRRGLISAALLVVVALGLTANTSAAEKSTRPPTGAERAEIVHAIKHAWRTQNEYAAVRKLGLAPVVKQIRVSRLDRHYAYAAVGPVDSHGNQSLETVEIVLIKIEAGWVGWRMFLSGSDFAFICAHPANAPAPVRELLCSR